MLFAPCGGPYRGISTPVRESWNHPQALQMRPRLQSSCREVQDARGRFVHVNFEVSNGVVNLLKNAPGIGGYCVPQDSRDSVYVCDGASQSVGIFLSQRTRDEFTFELRADGANGFSAAGRCQSLNGVSAFDATLIDHPG